MNIERKRELKAEKIRIESKIKGLESIVELNCVLSEDAEIQIAFLEPELVYVNNELAKIS